MDEQLSETPPPPSQQPQPNLEPYRSPRSRKQSTGVTSFLMLFVWTAVLGVGLLAIALQFRNSNGLSTTNSSTQTAANNTLATPASTITPAPSAGTQNTTAQLLSSGGSGASSSNSTAGSSSSSTNLSTDNAFNYYATLANGQLVAANPTPNPNHPSVLGADTSSLHFSSPTSYTTAVGGYDVVAGDFNNDGVQDAVTANLNVPVGTISFFPGVGGGAFGTRSDTAAGRQPTSIISADFNLDGNLDVAEVDYADNTISIFKGNGAGAFTRTVIATPASCGPRIIVTADFNHDGKPDLATVCSSNHLFSIYRNTSAVGGASISWGARLDFNSLPSGGGASWCLASADFNGDGWSDVVVGDHDSSKVTVILNTQGASTTVTFATPVAYTTSVGPVYVTTGDFNGDNHPDIAVADSINPTSNTVTVLLNNGNGTFAPAVDYVVGARPTSVNSADLNGDGWVDLVTTSIVDNTFSVLLGNGDGTFASRVDFSAAATSPVANSPQNLDIADVNADGKPDLLVEDGARMVVFLNSSTPPPNPSTSIVFSGSHTQTAGDYAPVTATLHDAGGNVTTATYNVVINLTNNITNGIFYPTSSGGTPITTATIGIGGSTATFYFRATTAGSGNITGAVTGFSNATFADTVTAAALSKFVFSPSSTSVTAGAPTSALAIIAEDTYGNAFNVGSSTVLTLGDGSHGGTFSLASSPFSAVSTATISSGASSVVVYYKNNTAGSYTLTAHNGSYTDASMSVTVNSGTSSSYVFTTAPSTGVVGSASTVFNVVTHDSLGNVITVPSNTTVYLYSSSGSGTFATSSGGPYTAVSTTIATGNTTASFYYKDSTPGAYTLTASDQAAVPVPDTGITNATTVYTVTAGTASVAVLTPATQTITANSPSSVITLTTKDSLGNISNVAANTTFALSSTGTGGAFSTTSGGSYSSTLNVTVNSGSSLTTFFYKNNVSGSYTLTAHNASFTDGTSTIIVNPAGIANYYFATAPASGTAGVASTVFTVGAHDAFGNVVTAASNTNVYLYSSAPAGIFSSTSGGIYTSALTVVITSGGTTTDFYYKNNSTSGSPYTLTASDNASAPDGATGIVDATTSYSVTSGTLNKFVFSPTSLSTSAGTPTSALTITAEDSLNNPVSVGSATVLSLSDGGGGGQFSLTSSPFSLISTATIASGTNNVVVYYRHTISGIYALTAHNSTYTDAVASVTVNPGVIFSYVFTTLPSNGAAGVASTVFNVVPHDAYGNVVTVASNTTVYLYSSSGTGFFAATSGGLFTATGIVILAGSDTGSFYYKDATPGTYMITASDQSVTPSPDTGIINANASFNVLGSSPTGVPHAPLTGRSAKLSDSRIVDPSVHYRWSSSSVTTVKGIRIQTCGDGIFGNPCVKPVGSDMTTVTLAATGGELGASGWSLSVVNDHEILVTNAAGAATTVGGVSTIDIAGFINPTVIGTFFYRVTTYSTTASLPGDALSSGSMGASTNRELTAIADVAENLTFRVANAVAADCSSQTDIADPNDGASDLVTLVPNTMSLSVSSVATAQMCVTTNADDGFVISYYDAALGGAIKGFWNGAHEFLAANQFTSIIGTEQFGFNLRANTAIGFEPDGNGLVADLTNVDYATVDRFSYNDTGSSTVLVSKTAPNAASARYTLSYLANIAPITPGGTYNAHQVFVITATY